MTLIDCLPTRTFELAVHGLDLARALGLPTPASLRPGIAASLELAGAIGARLPTAGDLLLEPTDILLQLDDFVVLCMGEPWHGQ